jgi:hypothetical protein
MCSDPHNSCSLLHALLSLSLSLSLSPCVSVWLEGGGVTLDQMKQAMEDMFQAHLSKQTGKYIVHRRKEWERQQRWKCELCTQSVHCVCRSSDRSPTDSRRHQGCTGHFARAKRLENIRNECIAEGAASTLAGSSSGEESCFRAEGAGICCSTSTVSNSHHRRTK